VWLHPKIAKFCGSGAVAIKFAFLLGKRCWPFASEAYLPGKLLGRKSEQGDGGKIRRISRQFH